MPELVAALAIAGLIFGGYQLSRRALERRAAAEQRAEEAVTLAVRHSDYRELDVALVLYSSHLSKATLQRLSDLRSDLYLKAEK